jgi:hypothetical protein
MEVSLTHDALSCVHVSGEDASRASPVEIRTDAGGEIITRISVAVGFAFDTSPGYAELDPASGTVRVRIAVPNGTLGSRLPIEGGGRSLGLCFHIANSNELVADDRSSLVWGSVENPRISISAAVISGTPVRSDVQRSAEGSQNALNCKKTKTQHQVNIVQKYN